MLKETLTQGQQLADAALERLLPGPDAFPPVIHKAMRHSVFAGGKRLRPILCMEAARMVSGKLPEGVDELGAAIEMLHTYSLIHDDLPCMDNDDLRRGRPTCHVAFGEALAVLAGDTLLNRAYEILLDAVEFGRPGSLAAARLIASAAGYRGMIGGQALDLAAEGCETTA